jgi:hypothetical protein
LVILKDLWRLICTRSQFVLSWFLKVMSKNTNTATLAEQDGLGDWRIQAASRIVADVPAAYPGGPAHKAGSVIVQTTMAATAQHPNLGFITPSAAALALSAGFRSAERAASLWGQVQYQTLVTPDGPGSGVNNIAVLFDYFEEALAAANSSFQAIEAFANATIARLLTGTMAVLRRTGPQQMDAEDIERRVSTSEKIATILPALLNAPSIKGGHEWQLFDKLKDVRDASTHFKSGDQYPGSGKAAKGSLYDVLLNSDPHEFPLTAVRVISKIAGTPQPRWLAHLIEKHHVV